MALRLFSKEPDFVVYTVKIKINKTLKMKDFKVYNFFLTKTQMTTFMEMFGASNCHGVVENKTDRTKEEKRMTVTFDGDAWKHLMNNHLTEDIVKTLEEF